MKGSEFPFPYLEHGTPALDAIGKASGAYLAFERPITRAQRAEVMRGCPAPIGGLWNWGPTLVACESLGDTFAWTLAEVYAQGDLDRLDAAVAARFAADVEAWARAVHARFPLVFFLGPLFAEKPSPWGTWSKQVLPAIMVPWLERYAEANAKDLVDDAGDDAEDEGRAPTDGVFDAIAMACLLQHLPSSSDRELARRAKALAKRFPL